jgi:ADP-ribose pyrophosphatase
MTFLPTPGLTDESITLFLGVVDASRLPETAGSASENEETRPFRATLGAAVNALAEGGLHNGCLIVALQWLALNRHRLDDLVRAASGR